MRRGAGRVLEGLGNNRVFLFLGLGQELGLLLMDLRLRLQFLGPGRHGVKGRAHGVGLLFNAGEHLGPVFLLLGALGPDLGHVHAAFGLG